MLKRSPDYVSCIEAFAGRQMFSCSAEASLTMCADLGKLVLGLGDDLEVLSSQDHDLIAKAYPTLWWIFLINALDCTGPNWLRSHLDDDDITSDRVLTWRHLRDSRMREECAPWLTVVGISGILHAFTHYPDHPGGPAKPINKKFFARIIQILRTVPFTTLVTASSDPLKATLPMYQKKEIRSYEFDSLHYACDALLCALKAPVFNTLSGALINTLDDLRRLKDMRQTMDSWLGENPDFLPIEEHYRDITQASLPPSIWLSSGLLRCISSYRLDLKRAKFLSKLIPDILIGPSPNSTLKLSFNQAGFIESSISTEKYIEEIHHIADLVWMPFSCESYASKLRATLQGAKVNNMRHDRLWDLLTLLCNTGALRTDEHSPSSPKSPFSNFNTGSNSPWNPHALGCCLYIKAGLVERLYSLRDSGDRPLDVLGWAVALAKHFAMLLKYWDHAGMDSDDQLYVITSLMNLIDTLLVALESQKTSTANQDHTTQIDRDRDRLAAARSQVESLVQSGVLQILARPFSKTFSPISDNELDTGKSECYEELTRMIDRLSREFKSFALNSSESSTGVRPYKELIAYYERTNSTHSAEMLGIVRKLDDYMTQEGE